MHLYITILVSFTVSISIAFITNAWLVERIALVGSFIGLVPSRNTGVAFGVRLGEYQGFWILCALIAIAVIAVRNAKNKTEQIGFGLIIGGGLSNIIDRTLDGSVTDMIQIGRFPIFNIADICINVGIAILFADIILTTRSPKNG